VTARCLLVYTVLLVFVNSAHGRGVYQRTKDGKALVWNNYPEAGDEATWSGDRDAHKYATGSGTLTWYRVERKVITGSYLPSVKGRTTLISRCSGEMVQGKFDGQVTIVDAKGKTFHGMFVDGNKSGDWAAGPPPAASEQRTNKNVRREADIEAPTEGPPPAAPEQRTNKSVRREADVEAPTEGPPPEAAQRPSVSAGPIIETPTNDSSLRLVATPPSSLRTPAAAEEASLQASLRSTPAASSSNPATSNSEGKDRMVADFKEQTQAVLARVGDATDNFQAVVRLDSVKPLPAPVSESIGPLADQARDLRSQPGYETALQECRTETETVDAISVVDQITRNIAANDVFEAGSRLAVFLKRSPEPTVDGQKALWRYLISMRSLCNRLEKDALVHVKRAQSLASAGKTSDAIREYQEAYRTFPNPATADTINQLMHGSRGL
jgi:hypothetical protein